VREATTIRVGSDHDVLVGPGVLRRAADLVPEAAIRALVVHPTGLDRYADDVADALRGRGLEVVPATVPDAEAAKTVSVAAGLWERLGRHGFTRTDTVVTVGGGTVTDLGGFVAACWLRGVSVVHVPTTLLGMVDAAVGGKTGVNTPQGKNLVGAFHPPVGVVCDLDTLQTLPVPDLTAGMAEVVKCGFIADPQVLALVEADPEGALVVGSTVQRELVERAIRVKAEVVARDPRESSLREILNYGHTLGHAIEQAEAYRMRHGEAVAIGMVFAAELARLAGLLDDAVVDQHRDVLTALGLPTAYLPDRWPQLLEVMRRDKKTRGARLRFVVLEGIGRPTRLEGPDEELLRTAYARTSGRAAGS
jgi:3-dehydroquinate synthase